MAYKSIGARSAVSNNVSNPTNLAGVAYPTPRATGDLLLCITTCRSITATASMSAPWQEWTGFPKRSATASGGSIYVFWREDDGIASSAVVTWTGVATGTTGDSSQAVILCFDSADAAPSDVTPPAPTDTSVGSPNLPSITTATAGATVVGISLKVNDAATTATIGNSFVERGDFHTTSGTGHHLYVATRDMPTPGVTNLTQVVVSPTTATRVLAVTIAIKQRTPIAFPRTASDTITISDSAGVFVFPIYTTLLDDFNRADNTVYSGAGAALWSDMQLSSSQPSTGRIVSNTLGSIATGASAASLFKLHETCDLFTTISAKHIADNHLIWFGITTDPGTPTTGYQLSADWDGYWSFTSYTLGMPDPPIAENPNGPVPAAGGDIWIARRGNITTAYYRIGGDFAPVLSATLPANVGRIGFSLPSTTVRYDTLFGGPEYFDPPLETIIDDFNRADGLLSTGWVLAPIAGGAATDLRVISNQLGKTATGTQQAYTTKAIDNSSGNCDVLIDCTVAPISALTNFYFLVNDPGTATWSGYQLTHNGGIGSLALTRYVGGSGQPSGTATTALAAGDKIWFRKRGTFITIIRIRDGISTALIRANAIYDPPSGVFGISVSDPNSRWDNLRGGPIAVPPTPTYETVIDDFNRANALIDAGDGAAIWTRQMFDGVALDPQLRTIGNLLGLGTNGYQSSYTKQEIEKDFDVLIDCVIAPTNEVGLFMISNPGGSFSGWALYWAGGNWILRRFAAGVNQGNLTQVAGTLVAGDTIWLRKRGSDLKLYKRPSGGSYTQILSATNAAYDSPGVIAIELNDTGARFDNLRGGPFVAPPANPPTASVVDDFNRANQYPPGSAWTGSWNVDGFRVVSNQLVNPSGSWDGIMWNATPAVDQECYITTAGIGADSSYLQLWARRNNATDTGYYLNLQAQAGAETWTIMRRISGADVGVGSPVSRAIAAGDTVGFKVVGSKIEMWHRPSGGAWTLVLAETDTQISASGVTGIYSNNPGWVLDDWGGPAVAGPISLPRTASDSVAISDSAVRAPAPRPRTAADSWVNSDSATRAPAARVRPVTDVVALSDAAVRTAGARARTATDSWARSDTATRAPDTRLRPATDSVTLSDSAAGIKVVVRGASDAWGTTDVADRAAASRTRGATDSWTRSDTATRAASTRIRPAVDTVVFSDIALRAAAARVRSAVDVFSIDDNAASVTQATQGKTATDSWVITDSVTRGPTPGAPAFSPSDLTGLAIWFDAAQLGLGDGTPISPWPNMGSGPAGDIVGSPAPKVAANRINGKPVVRFTASEGRVRMTGLPFDEDYTLVYVARMIGPTPGRIVNGIYSPNNILFGWWTSFQDVHYDNGFGTPNAQVPWNTDTKLYSGDGIAGVRSRLFSDGIWINTVETMQGFGGTFGISGYDPTTASETCDCEVAEVVVYSRTLSALDRQKVEGYLREKWITGGAGPAAPMFTRTAVDAVAFSDSVVKTGVQQRTATDSVAFADSAIAKTGVQKTATDAWSTADTANRTAARPRQVADIVTISDSSTRIVARPRPVSDSITFNDVATGIKVVVRGTSDAWSTTDTATRAAAARIRTAVDSWTGSDTAIRAPSARLRGASDAVTLSDTVSRTPAARVRGAIDSWSTADTAASITIGGSIKSALDTVVFSDVALRAAAARSRTAVDAWSSSDSIARTGTRPRAAIDTWSASDTATGIKVSLRGAVDNVVFSDTALRTPTARPRTATDSSAFSDSTTRTALHPGRTAVDNWSVVGTATALRALKRPVVDVITVSDTVARTTIRQRQLSDSITVTDAAQRIVIRARVVTDSITFSDTSTATGNRVRTAFDIVVISDTALGVMRAGAAPQMTMML